MHTLLFYKTVRRSCAPWPVGDLIRGGVTVSDATNHRVRPCLAFVSTGSWYVSVLCFALVFCIMSVPDQILIDGMYLYTVSYAPSKLGTMFYNISHNIHLLYLFCYMYVRCIPTLTAPINQSYMYTTKHVIPLQKGCPFVIFPCHVRTKKGASPWRKCMVTTTISLPSVRPKGMACPVRYYEEMIEKE